MAGDPHLRACLVSHCPILWTNKAMSSGVQKEGGPLGTLENTQSLWFPRTVSCFPSSHSRDRGSPQLG